MWKGREGGEGEEQEVRKGKGEGVAMGWEKGMGRSWRGHQLEIGLIACQR